MPQYNFVELRLHLHTSLPDYTEAFNWFEKAADQGLAGAQYNLGRMYNLGLGVAQDYTEPLQVLGPPLFQTS
ncbi:tetratricopeptide repeat protein [Candidatus Endomicrobiellum pyrsonymphae]|uniref:tetratricopeptide repeat protein n=1 Tax=Candidatus Endomicrobiellum pyrsonymphae TaxID=1408203 RepID=UPI0035A864EF